eukprot:CCRYP_012832-RA/>CCRYP_012832-RA protein AED:0.04 eAED:0.04 QI:150/1/1/1/1/1/3/177/1597
MVSTPPPDAKEKEARREKHKKRMNKILFKAWNLPSAAPFQDGANKGASGEGAAGNLTTVGENLDKGLYEHGRTGWEAFARDMGRVYNGHLMRKGKHATTAQAHLEKVVDFFSKIDPILGDIVLKSKPSENELYSSDATKNHTGKRKSSEVLDESQNSSPKKKVHVGNSNGSLTLSQREKRGIESLATYLEERGGECSQSDLFRCKVIQRPGGRYDTLFFSAENKRFKTMAEIARFLNLDDRPANSGGGIKNRPRSKGGHRQINRTPKESERKKLKRELDKLHKAYTKAAKLLEDHKNDSPVVNFPVIDDFLRDDGSNAARAHREGKIVPPSDIESFPGIPTHCIPDMLLVWDFLCTFGRTLSLEPIDLDDFAAALSFSPSPNGETQVTASEEMNNSSSSSNIPVYLSESHIALLRLLIQDPTSDTWWWSVLETPEMVEEEGDEYLNAVDRKRKMATAVVKIDMEGLLNVEEDPAVTTKWLQALDDVRSKKPDNSGPIKSAVKSAISTTTNHLVKAYLKKAMRKWRARSAGFVKRAVVWLIDKVREARPDLWGRPLSIEEIMEHKKSVVAEAALEMDRIVEDNDDDAAGDVNLEGDSDDESESEEDEMSDDEDEYADQTEPPASPSKQACSVTPNENDDITPVSTFVPSKPVPSMVDLLLPPAKPSLDIVHALTWPPVIGATSLRIFHWYKRRRNEVDDGIREFRQLKPMSVAERRRRESCAALRILSECGDQSGGKDNHVENAIQHLCDGDDYLALSAVQRLCIFRILIEAAYDTHHVQQTIEDNFKARMNAVKALDAEERRAKKESREELAAIEAAARERLAREAREAFIEKKRQEVLECIDETDLTEEDVENMEDDELIEFDDETKTEYDALPSPESFNKVEVNAMVTKIQEESAFGTEVLTVLTLKEIEKKDVEYLKSLEDELDSIGDVGLQQRNSAASREMSARIDRIRKEITNITDKSRNLAEDRGIAIDGLKDAIEDGTVKSLRAAIKAAKLARLSGDDDQTGGIWALDLLRDAALELKSAESRKRVTEAQKDLIAKRNKCFIRTDPLGKDRFQSCFVHFDYDKSSRIWVERDLVLVKNGFEAKDESAVLLSVSASASIGAPDQHEDFLAEDDRSEPHGKSFLSFARQEYHPSAELSSLSKHHWSCYTTDRSLRVLVKNLTGKCTQEKELKEALKETLETIALASGEKASINLLHVEDTPSEAKEATEFGTSGDSEAFDRAKQAAKNADINILGNVSSAIGKRIRLRRIPDPDRAPDLAQYRMGTITGWKLDETEEGRLPGQSHETTAQATWRLGLDDGGELHISADEVVYGMIRAIKWSTQYPGYVEHDAPFLSYRNGHGRFCGRAAEAPSSLTPLAFAKQMLKKEQDLYMPLKNRTFENNWGGKSGARNAWVSSLKEYGHTFEAVRDGLLTLEDAFFNLAGGFGTSNTTSDTLSDGFVKPGSNDDSNDVEGSSNAADPANINGTTNGKSHLESSVPAVPKDFIKLTGKDLFYDEVSRFDIELESLGNEVKGLWNNPDTREIFREIMSVCKTVSILALGLDLIGRNCQAHINRTKASLVQTATKEGENASSISVGRRRAALKPGAYADFF